MNEIPNWLAIPLVASMILLFVAMSVAVLVVSYLTIKQNRED